MRATVTARFHDRERAGDAVRALTAKSVPVDAIRVFVVGRDGQRLREVPVDDEAGTLEGAAIGAAVGAAVGVVVVMLAPTGFLGPSTSSFLLTSGLAGALRAIAVCAVAGLPLGAILGMGHWRGTRKISPEEVAGREIEIVVVSEALSSLARGVLEEAGASRVE